MLSDLELGGPDDFSYDLRGQRRPKITNIVILQSLKDGHFYILQNGQFGVEACGPTVLPDQKWQKVSILKIQMRHFVWFLKAMCNLFSTFLFGHLCSKYLSFEVGLYCNPIQAYLWFLWQQTFLSWHWKHKKGLE